MTMLSEAEARALIDQLFKAAGFAVAHDRVITVGGHRLEIDGYDERHRVGYEFLSHNDHKRAQYTKAAMQALEQAIEQRSLFVFVLDAENLLLGDAQLRFAVEHFLAQVKQHLEAA
jgi:hypothetical protein